MKKAEKIFAKILTIAAFVLITVALVIIARVGENSVSVLKKIYNFCAKTDKGYMWIINIIVATIISKIITKIKVIAKVENNIILTILSSLIFIMSVVVAEIVLWHPNEVPNMLGLKINSVKDLSTGIISATITFGLFIATSIEYDE